VAQLFLDVAFVDLGGRGKTCAKGVAGELEATLHLAEITTYAGGDCRPFHQPRDLLVVQLLRTNSFPLSSHAAEEGAVRQFGELDPGLDRDDMRRYPSVSTFFGQPAAE
jgi:hypothetical protein